MTGSDELRTRWDATMMRTYPLPPLAFVRGEGSSLVAESGERYLDFLSGIAVTSLGHAHPAVAGAVAEQVARLTHTSNLFVTEPAVAGAVGLGHAIENFQQQAVCPLADGVHNYLQTGGIGPSNPGTQRVFGRHHQSRSVGRIIIWLVKKGSSGAERAVYISLYSRQPEPLVSPPVRPDRVGHSAPLSQWHVNRDPRSERASRAGPSESGKLEPGHRDVGHRCDAFTGGPGERPAQGGITLTLGWCGDDCQHWTLRFVL
jgi:hypothetical protein